MKRTLRHLVWLAVFATTSAGAQEPPAPEQPVFRAGADMVAVDVSVVDRNGAPIADLKPEEFTLEVDGEPRQIASVEFVSRKGGPAAPSGAPTGQSRFTSNQTVEAGRLLVIVLDAANVRRGGGRPVTAAASRFLDTLTPADRVALAILPNGRHIDFTDDRELIREGLKGFVGDAPPQVGTFTLGLTEALAVQTHDEWSWQNALDRECRDNDQVCPDALYAQAMHMLSELRQQFTQSVTGLRDLVRNLAEIQGPKTIVFISEGLPSTEQLEGDLMSLSRATSAAQVSVYTLKVLTPSNEDIGDRPSPTSFADARIREQGLDMLAGYTRGSLFNIAGSGDFAFERISRELSGYYLLSFEPLPEERDGKNHSISIKLKRSGVSMRARREFTMRDPKSVPPTTDERLGELMRAPFPVQDLPLRVGTFTLRDRKSDQLRLVITAEVDKNAAADSSYDTLAALFDSKGDLVKTSLRRGKVAQETQSGPRFWIADAAVDPGRYTLKVAVVDQEGRSGSVVHRLEAKLTRADPLLVGDLILAEEISADGQASLRPTLALEPGVETIGAYLEIYGNGIEAISDVQVAVDVAREDDANTLVSVPAYVGPPAAEGRSRTVRGIVSIGLLPPGNYVAHARVSAGDRSLGSVRYPFNIPPRPAGARAARRRAVVAGIPGDSAPVPTTVEATVQRFNNQTVLNPGVVGFFLDRFQADGHKPSSPSVQAAIAEARAGNLHDAGQKLDEKAAGASKADQLGAAFIKGLALFAKNDLQNALNQFRAALGVSSDFFPALFYVGACYAAGGRDREAAAAWQTSLITETESPIIYTVLADALVRVDDTDSAIAVLLEALESWPDESDFERRLAIAYLTSGQEGQAFPLLVDYLERHPSDQEALFLTIRAIYEAHAAGRAIVSREQDLDKFAQYSKSYADLKGPQLELVTEWGRFLQTDNR